MRYLIASRKRPDLDIQFLVGNFEFSVIPKALLTPDGEALMCSDKLRAQHLTEEMQCQRNGDEGQFIKSEALLIDAMAVVNQIQNQGKHMLNAFTF